MPERVRCSESWVAAHFTRQELDGGSSRYSPGVASDGALERAIPRLVVEYVVDTRRQLAANLLVGILSLVLAVVFALQGWPLASFYAALFGVGGVLLVVWLQGLGARHETIEVDSRFLSVTRGGVVMVWPTAKCGGFRVAVDPPGGVFARTFIWQPPAVEWGDNQTVYHGYAASGLDEPSATKIIHAMEDFVAEHPADASVRFMPGESLLQQVHAESDAVDA